MKLSNHSLARATQCRNGFAEGQASPPALEEVGRLRMREGIWAKSQSSRLKQL